MAKFELFSERQKKMSGTTPDVYTYDDIPNSLRVQVVHIWRDALGTEEDYDSRFAGEGPYAAYKFIAETLCREYGLFVLPPATQYGQRHFLVELANFLLREEDPTRVLDAVELSFRYIDVGTRSFEYRLRRDASARADAAINELNSRFQDHAVGYQYTHGEIVRVDSQFMHKEVVVPTLILLRGGKFSGAEAEFLKAHEHYRKGRRKEAIAECLKSFESVMKTICKKRGWPHDPNATSSALLQTLFDRNLIPPYWQSHYSALRTTLESGVPTGRNKTAGHGQGAAVVEVPEHLVSYMLHMTASAIHFLVEAENALA